MILESLLVALVLTQVDELILQNENSFDHGVRYIGLLSLMRQHDGLLGTEIPNQWLLFLVGHVAGHDLEEHLVLLEDLIDTLRQNLGDLAFDVVDHHQVLRVLVVGRLLEQDLRVGGLRGSVLLQGRGILHGQ